ncbi:ABC transporter ATP-binding protein [Corynebacterium choanae]|uniref:Teichoic acids export ATP-binding protein TagH n=1 Tax=Corynebacterium choanae TaxID=1862358 RepID=A0A3G6J566_9CORY|nr:ABC transporter ATP-binding protein [Corynebacterium choanae]AZA13241.1 Teichoic acids export ATP-binding protein TagH [Corynebacterium choanae]
MQDEVTSKDQVAVHVEHLSVHYKVDVLPSPKQSREQKSRSLLGSFQRTRKRLVKALDDIHLTVNDGESVALVGLNGSGKSTLLRAIGGLETPTSGFVLAKEQPILLGVSAALESGISGYENIRLGCLAMGLSPAEIDEQIDEIRSFIDIGDAIFNPMKTYSSGMQARLRFAITTMVEPKIMMIDEALATGDSSFVERSRKKMRGLTERAGTLFLVSHDRKTVRQMCDRAIWLHQGQLIADGETRPLLDLYNTFIGMLNEGKQQEAAEFAVSVRQQ